MRENATCSRCSIQFDRDTTEYWKKLCIDCFKFKKRRESDEIQEEIEAAYRRGYRAGQLYTEPSNGSGTVDDQLIERMPALIQLCHPDKHNNSKAATAITQWLIALRREFRAKQQ